MDTEKLKKLIDDITESRNKISDGGDKLRDLLYEVEDIVEEGDEAVVMLDEVVLSEIADDILQFEVEWNE